MRKDVVAFEKKASNYNILPIFYQPLTDFWTEFGPIFDWFVVDFS